MVTKLTNGRIISQGKVISGEDLYFDENGIIAIGGEREYEAATDAAGGYVSAGFIDMHVHGGGGYDFMDGGTEPIVRAAAVHLAHGTTSIMPTTLACSTEVLLEFLKDLRVVMDNRMAKSNIIGAHLEGPYFSHAQSGAQNPDYIVEPREEEYREILQVGEGIISRWSFAPELRGGVEFCRFLAENGIVSSIAHSDAVYDDVLAAYQEGCRLVTHLYSGMSTITRHGGFRRLGVVESAYLFDDMAVEVIADGCHLPPELLRLVVKQKGTDEVCLVTDSMRGAGMPDGESLLGRAAEGMPCFIEDGVAKMMDRSGFAGSVATADRLVRTMVKQAGASVADAVKMMTQNPARILKLADRGDIAPGLRADIVVFDDDIRIQKVFVGGKAVED